ncbi:MULTISPECIES: hypothetical protein [Moorena]|uniref:Uncharacterized protein n=1 Tax=Moorena producens 3L TaxID=489825 RepID=F4XZR7_9CYAN|nr:MULTISPECIES: hypothetical protein [Moorena]EGJ29835.1 hypothetical protein LYNGBM3L_58860 [Moorena producens 3L]NEP37436.1 hypothetical protein [Moorena sp. SIO3B2]NEP66748.1 hypothetical protein [Moorena sp. SIO3A5]NER87140.1 hypothetical protein [Moorena sp. SIO3A2]NES40117.1 hypothetical protein [Moorena sp. SIO2C4]
MAITYVRNCDAARSWGASAVLGVPPMSNWRGFPHERLHQDSETQGHRGENPPEI